MSTSASSVAVDRALLRRLTLGAPRMGLLSLAAAGVLTGAVMDLSVLEADPATPSDAVWLGVWCLTGVVYVGVVAYLALRRRLARRYPVGTEIRLEVEADHLRLVSATLDQRRAYADFTGRRVRRRTVLLTSDRPDGWCVLPRELIADADLDRFDSMTTTGSLSARIDALPWSAVLDRPGMVRRSVRLEARPLQLLLLVALVLEIAAFSVASSSRVLVLIVAAGLVVETARVRRVVRWLGRSGDTVRLGADRTHVYVAGPRLLEARPLDGLDEVSQKGSLLVLRWLPDSSDEVVVPGGIVPDDQMGVLRAWAGRPRWFGADDFLIQPDGLN